MAANSSLSDSSSGAILWMGGMEMDEKEIHLWNKVHRENKKRVERLVLGLHSPTKITIYLT